MFGKKNNNGNSDRPRSGMPSEIKHEMTCDECRTRIPASSARDAETKADRHNDVKHGGRNIAVASQYGTF